MIQKVKPAIVLLMHFLFLQTASGQQPLPADYLTQRFQNYCKATPREEIYIHTDRHEYISGEDMWFNIYLIDRQSFKPSAISRIVYFEVLNNENRPVVQKRILTDKGFGPGQVILPDTLSTGTYIIRAYTNWMKNFLPENCFTCEINVYNALKSTSFKGLKKDLSVKGKSLKSDSGVSLKVDNSDSQALKIEVTSTDKFRSDNNNVFYIFIQTHGNLNHISSEKLTGSTTLLYIPRTKLSPGINQITIFNSKAEPVSEKYVYTAGKILNPLVVDVTDSCGLRDKLSLEILATAMNTMSVSVAPARVSPDEVDIDDYLIFGSEFGVNPQHFLKGKKVSGLNGEIDSLLQHVSSNWIDWSLILSDSPPKFRYKPEKEDHFLFGKLLTSASQPAASGNYILMMTPGKKACFQYAKTDSDGNFSFSLHIDEEQKDLIIMPDDISNNHKIIIESSFFDKYLNTTAGTDTGEIFSKDVSRLSVNHQVQKIYGVSAPGTPPNSRFKPDIPVRFYGKPDIELILTDYIKLPVMSEVFFELLPGVSLKKKKSSAEISITYRIQDDQYTIIPALMIDGVIIKDPMLIANLDPELVEKIDVIREKYQVGKYYFPGLINVITKAADFSSVPLPDYMIRLPYKVIDPVLSFVSPDYSNDSLKQSRIPDYRNTLYWNPSVTPDNDGKVKVEFWSSDNKADYLLDIQGIKDDGKVFSFRKIVRVK